MEQEAVRTSPGREMIFQILPLREDVSFCDESLAIEFVDGVRLSGKPLLCGERQGLALENAKTIFAIRSRYSTGQRLSGETKGYDSGGLPSNHSRGAPRRTPATVVWSGNLS